MAVDHGCVAGAFRVKGGSLLQLACNRAPRGTVHCATELMRARLYWHDGRVEEVTVVPRTELIVRDTPAGFRHFLRSDEPDDDGIARFIEENVTDEDEWP